MRMELQTDVRPLRAVLDDLRDGRMRIPMLQRPFVWANSQVNELLDSVRNQYPIGSLMLWQVNQNLGYKFQIGPIVVPQDVWRPGQTVDYLLDGQQRMTTLLGALYAPEGHDPALRRWQLHFDAEAERFGVTNRAPAPHQIPMRLVLDSFKLLQHLDTIRKDLPDKSAVERIVGRAQALGAAFQQYRVPTLTLKGASLDEAVRVFVRVNKQGTLLSADDLFSALASGVGENRPFDYRDRVDRIKSEVLRPLGFADISRMTLLRCLLAALGEEIFETDLPTVATKYADKLPATIEEIRGSTARAARWLRERIGVAGPKALPYALQFVLLSEFFRQGKSPSPGVERRLERWIWTTSFNSSFAAGKPLQFDRSVKTARRLATEFDVDIPDLGQWALPFPGKFHPRSARVRGFLLALKRMKPRSLATGAPLRWDDLLERGLNDTFRISGHADPRVLADRVLVGEEELKDSPLELLRRLKAHDLDTWKLTVDSHVIGPVAWQALERGDSLAFIASRRNDLEAMERRLFQEMQIKMPHAVDRADEETDDSPIEAEDFDDREAE